MFVFIVHINKRCTRDILIGYRVLLLVVYGRILLHNRNHCSLLWK